MTGKSVEVVDYDESWRDAFERVRQDLELALGSAALAVHHIGSTSVPGMRAKPVIDVLVEVSELELIEQRMPAFAALGYQARGDYGIPGRLYFSRSATGDRLPVHVHAYRRGDPQVARHLSFRDSLREHPEMAREYSELKTSLAAAHAHDRDAYQAGKADFIAAVESRN